MSLDAVKAAVAAFSKVQSQYDRLGAGDTEPDGHFHHALRSAAVGRTAIPTLARGWELYGMKGSGAAARALTQATREVVRTVKAAMREDDAPAVVAWLQAFAWRVAFYDDADDFDFANPKRRSHGSV